jgi:hypothetical protein
MMRWCNDWGCHEGYGFSVVGDHAADHRAGVGDHRGMGNRKMEEQVMETHEYAALFPMASDDELKEMALDIKQRGLLNSIITLDGKILDGRNRAKACVMAGVVPHYEPYTGDDPLGDVISWNLKRRHLTPSQRAELARAIKPMFEARARERMQERKGEQAGATKANLPYLDKGQSRDQAAAAVGVSGRTVQDAEYVHKHAPELSEKIKSGEMTVNAAKKEVKERVEYNNDDSSKKKEVCKAKVLGVGIRFATDAINALRRIPKDDPLRAGGFRQVADWIETNK